MTTASSVAVVSLDGVKVTRLLLSGSLCEAAGCGPDSFDVARVETSGFIYIGRLDRLMRPGSASAGKSG